MIAWLPDESDEVVKVAVPPDRDAVPSVVPPSMNVTVPVGVKPDTVAVKVTLCPAVGTVLEADRLVVVEAFPTTTVAEWPPSLKPNVVEAGR